MCADGAELRGLGADNDVAAVTALPNLNLALLKDLLGLHVVQESAVSVLVALLDGCNAAELGSKLLEAFFFSFLGHTVIHIGPLEVLALSGVEKILGGIAQLTQLLEPKLCMLFLVLCGLQEQLSNLLKSSLLSHGSELGVLVSRLGFTCECFPQVLFGFGTSVFICHIKCSPFYTLSIKLLYIIPQSDCLVNPKKCRKKAKPLK